MQVNADDSDSNHPNVKNWIFFLYINLAIDDFVYMYHHKIQFYDTISKLGHKGERSISHSDIC